MKGKSLLKLLSAICLAALIAIPLVVSCAAPEPIPGPAGPAGPAGAPGTPGAPAPTPVPAPAVEYKWRLSSHWSDWELEETQWWTHFIEDASGGRISIDLYGCDVLVPGTDNMKECGAGTIDMAIGFGAYWSDLIPAAAFEAGVPFAFRTRDELLTFYYDYGYLEILRKAYAEHNVYLVAPLMGGLYTVMSAKEFHSVEEWQEVKTRAIGITAEVLDEAGIPTTYVSGSEMYLAMSTGVIDAFVWCCPYTYYELKYYEVADYLIDPPIFSNTCNPLLMNLDLWNSLPDDLKAIIEVSGKASNVDCASMWSAGTIGALPKLAEEGVSWISLPPEEVRMLTEKSLVVAGRIADRDPVYATPALAALKDLLRNLGYL